MSSVPKALDKAVAAQDWPRASSEAIALWGRCPAASLHWFAHARSQRLELGDWHLQRGGKRVSLRWAGRPIWGEKEGWELAAFLDSALPWADIAVAFAERVMGLTPGLRRALGEHLPATVKRA